jgi:hypothetical protein
MQHEANHTPNPDGTASLLLASLEQTWQTIRQRHPDVPEAVLLVAFGSEGKRLTWATSRPTAGRSTAPTGMSIWRRCSSPTSPGTTSRWPAAA